MRLVNQRSSDCLRWPPNPILGQLHSLFHHPYPHGHTNLAPSISFLKELPGIWKGAHCPRGRMDCKDNRGPCLAGFEKELPDAWQGTPGGHMPQREVGGGLRCAGGVRGVGVWGAGPLRIYSGELEPPGPPNLTHLSLHASQQSPM